jgi:predicted GIY-YIG superfamily endonuclease
MSPFHIYIPRCSDGTYYVGMTGDLGRRVEEHRRGLLPRSYTAHRRSVELVWSQLFTTHDEAFRWERRLKGWSHAKKQALIELGPDEVHKIMRRRKIVE